MEARVMKDDLPRAVWSGSFTLLGVELKCHTLSNGQRIIEEDSIAAFLTAQGSPDVAAAIDAKQFNAFMKWRKGD